MKIENKVTILKIMFCTVLVLIGATITMCIFFMNVALPFANASQSVVDQTAMFLNVAIIICVALIILITYALSFNLLDKIVR